ncbi:MAG: sulfite exporter TauE/SafE family protein [Acidobacteriota bacterium]
MTLAWIGALAIGLSLGLLGSGGSILTVPVLIYLVGQDEKTAIAGSLFIVGAIAAGGGLQFAVQRVVSWRSVALFGLPSMVGTYAGAWLGGLVSGTVQLAVFATVMLLAAGLMFQPPALDAGPRTARAAWKVVLDGLAVGVLTGLVGVGGGFLIVPALVLLGGLPMHLAIGTSLVIIALKSFTGFFKYLEVLERLDLSLDWNPLLVIAAVGLAGSFVGRSIGKRVSQRNLRRVFAAFLVAIGLLILGQTLPELIPSRPAGTSVDVGVSHL